MLRADVVSGCRLMKSRGQRRSPCACEKRGGRGLSTSCGASEQASERGAQQARKRERPSRHPGASSTESETHKQKRHFFWELSKSISSATENRKTNLSAHESKMQRIHKNMICRPLFIPMYLEIKIFLSNNSESTLMQLNKF
jgi:hypothetical protein